MSDDINRVLEKLDKIDERQDRMETVLTANTADLKEHMRRTSNLEQRISPLEKIADKARGAGWLGGVLVAAVLGAKSLGLF